MSLYSHQTSNIVKTWLLLGGAFVLVIAVGFVLAQVYESSLILYIAVGFSIIMNFIAYFYSDKLALRASGAKPASQDEYPELHNIVENLSITAGLPKPRVYIINDQAPNAFATGRNPKHAAVAFTTGIMAMLDRSELEGVAAHELAHIKNRDILISTIAVVVAGSLAILSDFFLRISLFGGMGRDKNAGPLGIIIAVAVIILAPIAATLIQLAISRKREFLADASGALLTRYPEGLANALQKISSYGGQVKRASNATAHLYISNPFGGRGALKGIKKLFSTHPPMEERVKALLGKDIS